MKAASALFAVLAAFAMAGNADGSANHVSLTVDKTTISSELGHKFVFRSTIRNPGRAAATNLAAHLNVLSLQDGVYVDPEDWSSQRTQYLAEVPAHGSVHLTWRLHAVNAGRFVAYVALTDGRPGGTVTAGPACVVTVAKRQSLDAAGVLPTAIVVPAALLALLVFVGYRRRRRR